MEYPPKARFESSTYLRFARTIWSKTDCRCLQSSASLPPDLGLFHQAPAGFPPTYLQSGRPSSLRGLARGLAWSLPIEKITCLFSSDAVLRQLHPWSWTSSLERPGGGSPPPPSGLPDFPGKSPQDLSLRSSLKRFCPARAERNAGRARTRAPTHSPRPCFSMR